MYLTLAAWAAHGFRQDTPDHLRISGLAAGYLVCCLRVGFHWGPDALRAQDVDAVDAADAPEMQQCQRLDPEKLSVQTTT